MEKIKHFQAKVATSLVAKVSLPYREFKAMGIVVNELAKQFQVEHPEYAQCTYTFEITEDLELSFWVTSGIIFDEV